MLSQQVPEVIFLKFGGSQISLWKEQIPAGERKILLLDTLQMWYFKLLQSCSRAIDTRSENKGLCISIKVFDNRFLHPNEVHSNLVQILKGLNLLISPKTHTGWFLWFPYIAILKYQQRYWTDLLTFMWSLKGVNVIFQSWYHKENIWQLFIYLL